MFPVGDVELQLDGIDKTGDGVPSTSKVKTLTWTGSPAQAQSLMYVLKSQGPTSTAFLQALRKRKHIDDGVNVLRIKFHLTDLPRHELDYEWEHRICTMFKRYLELERLMWVLSTLGGALSAMGDFYDDFASRASEMSLRQLKVAHELGDPVLEARCRLYIALSLAQKRRYRAAREIVQHELNLGKDLDSELLQECARGVWAKILSIRKTKKQQQKTISVDKEEKVALVS